MDAWDGNIIRGGVAYPQDPERHYERIEHQAVRMLRDQLRDATIRLHEPTRQTVEAVVRYRITSIQSSCARALTYMANFPFYNAMAGDIREEILEQLGGVQMPQPVGPEWDPEDDEEMDEDEPEDDEEADSEMDEGESEDEDLMEEVGVVPGDFEGTPKDGEIVEGEGPGFSPLSPIV